MVLFSVTALPVTAAHQMSAICRKGLTALAKALKPACFFLTCASLRGRPADLGKVTQERRQLRRQFPVENLFEGVSVFQAGRPFHSPWRR